MVDGALQGLPITYGQFTAKLLPETSLALPPFAGSMFRGAFGMALQETVCVTRTYDCPPCSLRERCLYPYVFETPPPRNTLVMRKYTAAPHPFVFEPPEGGAIVPPGQPVALGLTLFGKALAYLSYFVFALERLGQRGLGGRRVRCRLASVESSLEGREWVLYSAEERVLRSAEPFQKTVALPCHPSAAPQGDGREELLQIELVTPLRLVYDSRLARELPFHVLARSLLRRVAHLSYFHCGGDPRAIAFKEWIALAEGVQIVGQDLEWYDWVRYSNRQRQAMTLGGLVGRVTFQGKVAPFRPLLSVGEVAHVGKGTSFGLGCYRVVR
jgi:hypothetical protein